MRTSQQPTATGEVLRAVLAALESVDHGARKVASHEDRLEWLRLAKDVRRRVEGLSAALTAEADRARSSEVVAGTPITSWLAQDKRVSLKEATRDVLGAKDLASREKVKAAALEGDIGVEQAKAINRVMKDLPKDLDEAQKALAEELLLVKAATTPAGSIRHLRQQVLEAIRPETGDTRESEMRRLEEQRRRALSRRFFTFDDDGDGSFQLRGSLPYLEAQPFMTVVDGYVESQRRERRGKEAGVHITQNARRADALTAITAALMGGGTAGAGATTFPSGATSGSPAAPAAPPGSAGSSSDAPAASPGATGSSPGATTFPSGATSGSAGVPTAPPAASGGSPSAPTAPPGSAGSSSDAPAASPGSAGGSAGAPNLPPGATGSSSDAPAASPGSAGAPTAPSVSARGSAGAPTAPPAASGGSVSSLPPIRVPKVAGERPRVTVTMRESDLRELAEQAGILPNGTTIPPGDLRRLVCDAHLVPVVLGTDSEILDVGMSSRLVTPAIRRALSLRDGECAFPGCDVPDVRCEAHHIVPWWANGPTKLSNLVLLCPHHHGVIEPPRFFSGPQPDRWQIRMGENGKPEFIPPRSLAKISPSATYRSSRTAAAGPRAPDGDLPENREKRRGPGDSPPPQGSDPPKLELIEPPLWEDDSNARVSPIGEPAPDEPLLDQPTPAEIPPGELLPDEPPPAEPRARRPGWPDFDNPGPPPPWAVIA